MFEPRPDEDDGVDRASCSAANSSINQSQFDAYQQLQQRATETLRVFTTQPIVSAAGRAPSNSANRTVSPPTGGGDAPEYVPLDEMFAVEYSRDMDRRWNDEPPLSYNDACGDVEDVEEEGEVDEEEDGDQWSNNNEPEPRRRNLFGRSNESDMEEESQQSGTARNNKRPPPVRPDDNPRQRKRHRPPNGGDSGSGDAQYDTRNRHECFLCSWGNALHDGIEAPHINKMTDIIHQNFGVHHNKEIATEVVLYYMEEVYDPALGMAPLTRQVVLEHLEHHTLDARIFIGEAIKREKELAFLFLNRVWRADGTYDKNYISEYRRSMGAICSYYNMNVARMNFNNGNNAEDMKKQANYMNLMMPRFDQRAPGQPVPGARRARAATTGQANKTSVPASRKQFT